MATLVRRIFKVALFVGLFLLSMRYIHTYPLPMTLPQQNYLIVISGKFGVRDYEGFYLSAVAIVNLIVAAFEYVTIMKLWHRYRTKHLNRAAS
jgi:hypothetical protein